MLPLAADENFNAHILRGLERGRTQIDLVTAQQAAPRSTHDPEILAWAAGEERVLLTHDVNTVTKFAWDRVRQSLTIPGVLAVPSEAPIGAVVKDLLLVLAVHEPGELEGQILYVPF